MSLVTPPVAVATSTRRKGPFGAVGIVCLVVIGLAAFVAVIGSWVAPQDPNASNFDNVWIGPFQEPGHLLGFDGQGRDLLSRLLVGARTAVLGPLAVVIISVVLGIVLAVFAAWKGGRVDGFLGALFDILFAFPGILLAILAAAVFGKGIPSAVIALSIAYVPFIARVLRSSAIRVRSQAYIAALEVQGQSAFRICWQHIIPNMASLIVAQATTLFGYAMVDLAAISFLGLGVQAPAADWGYMVNENQSGILQSYPFPTLISGLLIVIVVVAVNVLGERLHQRSTQGSRA
jgi:peptide/nickel transport system permease protein